MAAASQPGFSSPLAARQASIAPFVAQKPLRRGTGRLLPYRLGEYALVEHIGKGGMADIYRATQTTGAGVEREVVIKEVLPELREHTRFAELLASEAKLAARLHHPNIVGIEKLGRDVGSLYIAMEYVDGIDLRELLRRSARARIPLPVDFAIHVVLEVIEALGHAHRFRWAGSDGEAVETTATDDGIGIVHRDVSPSNILLSFDGEVRLCDFGIARAHDVDLDADTALTSAMVEGKAGYMSPEQAKGMPLDGRADLFAAGIVLFELLTGRKYYKAAAGQSLLDLARRAEGRAFEADYLPELDRIRAILGRALATDREDRYGSAEEFGRDLDAYAASTGLVASAMRLGEWLAEHFEPDVRKERHMRALAGKAIALGPLVELKVVGRATPAVAPEGIDESCPTPTPTGTHPPLMPPPEMLARRKGQKRSRTRDDERAGVDLHVLEPVTPSAKRAPTKRTSTRPSKKPAAAAPLAIPQRSHGLQPYVLGLVLLGLVAVIAYMLTR